MNDFTSEKILKPSSGYPVIVFMIVIAMLSFIISATTGTAGWIAFAVVVLIILGKGLVVAAIGAASGRADCSGSIRFISG